MFASWWTELERLWRRLRPLALDKMPPDFPPPRDNRFGSALVLRRVLRIPTMSPADSAMMSPSIPI
jgi:hypothetical protein